MRTLALVVSVLVMGCGYTSAGGGTGTLYVTARLTSDGSTSGSRARVTVRQGSSTGDFVEDATVTIRGGGQRTPTSLPLSRAERQYQLNGFEWSDVFRLEVVRVDDRLDGTIDTPGATLITNPVEDQTVASNQSLTLQWKDSRNARAMNTHARLQRADIDRDLGADALEWKIEAGTLEANHDERIRIERGNAVELFGGATGSELSAATDHEIKFNVE